MTFSNYILPDLDLVLGPDQRLHVLVADHVD